MNTLENKARFFHQYYGQRVLNHKGYNENPVVVNEYNFGNYHLSNARLDEDWLELKPLSSISDEDAEEIGINVAYVNFFNDLHYIEADYLRSKGYALPWNGISVEQQIEWGWIKLLENQSD